jgi:polyphosphate glucokinase
MIFEEAPVPAPRTLVIDLGGQTIKLAVGDEPAIRIPSGPTLGPSQFVQLVREAAAGLRFDRVSIGVPGPVRDGALALEPHNLATGWIGFDLTTTLEAPTRVVNDAALQAIGGYAGDKMLFLGLGTGLGSALVVPGYVLALEFAHLPYHDGLTFEDEIGARGLDRLGEAAWRRAVDDVVARLRAATVADYVLLGGGNAPRLQPLPPSSRLGTNEHAIIGGERLWEERFQVL